jgi:hypothetical protein
MVFEALEQLIAAIRTFGVEFASRAGGSAKRAVAGTK